MKMQSNKRASNNLMKEDKLSDLPDSLIQHILSFLPTRDVICTGILSKRWRNQWRQVPILRFHCKNIKFINNVLNQYECSKVLKLSISAHDYLKKNRYLKELSLRYHHLFSSNRFGFPEFLFSFTLLWILKIRFCTLQPKEMVNWKHLKEFKADCCVFSDRAIENVFSGCPLLESLRLRFCDFYHLVIASKSLRKLALLGLNVYYVGISCPNLEELRLEDLYCAYTIEDESIVLCDTVQFRIKGEFVVTSWSLKKLVLNNFKISCLMISCPSLEELKLLCLMDIKTARLLNLWSLISATVDSDRTLRIKGILLQLQHVKELKLQRQLIKILEGTDLSTLSLSNKCLTLDGPSSDGVAMALRLFYTLEKLVIKLPVYNAVIKENDWSSNTSLFYCSVHRLRIVQINGLIEKNDHCKGVLNFVEFVLKNAQILEKLTLTIENGGRNFLSGVSRKISSVQWCSQHAMVELLHWENLGWIKKVISMKPVL